LGSEFRERRKMAIVISRVVEGKCMIMEIRNASCALNKRQRKPKGQSRTDNPDKLATVGTQDARRRQR
jgi:hypothetical protein